MKDRGIIKWQPFNSVVPSSKIIKSILKEKRKIKKPLLSQDQLNTLQRNLISAFHNHSKVCLYYYFNGEIQKEEGFVNQILKSQKAIIFNNKTIFFVQLLKIKN